VNLDMSPTIIDPQFNDRKCFFIINLLDDDQNLLEKSENKMRRNRSSRKDVLPITKAVKVQETT
jgi:hypothetical protein